FLPGTVAGGAIRWYKFSLQDKKPAQAIAVIVFARLIDTSVMTAAGLVFWALDAQARHSALYGIVLGGVFVGLCGIGLLFFRRRPARALTSWLTRQNRLPELITQKLAKVLRAAAEFGGLRGLTILKMATKPSVDYFGRPVSASSEIKKKPSVTTTIRPSP
ncbi:MAG: lysylphosphatidylglycerol synthase domain-containing protein, partial [Acidobacteriales bacterium]|nr:lysylphosphatidylglycerol synthase domain-containing protein [Terriglobales bacterium]